MSCIGGGWMGGGGSNTRDLVGMYHGTRSGKVSRRMRCDGNMQGTVWLYSLDQALRLVLSQLCTLRC